jgi:hypothetical protein
MKVHTAICYLYDEVPEEPTDNEPSIYQPIRVLLAEGEAWRQAQIQIRILMSATLSLMDEMHKALKGELHTESVLADVDRWLIEMSPEFVRYTEMTKEATL